MNKSLHDYSTHAEPSSHLVAACMSVSSECVCVSVCVCVCVRHVIAVTQAIHRQAIAETSHTTVKFSCYMVHLRPFGYLLGGTYP